MSHSASWSRPFVRGSVNSHAKLGQIPSGAPCASRADLSGELKTTITLKQVSVGTDVTIVQEGIPEVIPPEACCLGWRESPSLLAQQVEADLPE